MSPSLRLQAAPNQAHDPDTTHTLPHTRAWPTLSAANGRLWLLASLTVMAVVPRLLALVGSGRLGADEAVEGLMARHIVESHELPAFFWGQDYFGAAEAYLVAGLFAVCGLQPWLVFVPALIASLALVPVIWAIAEHLGPPPASLLAALPIALPAPVFARLLGNAGGGFALGFALEFGALLCLLRGSVALFSLLLGLAVWVWQPTVFAAPLLIACALVGRRRHRPRLWQFAPLAVGVLPILIYNVPSGWPTLTALLIKFRQQHEMEIDPLQLVVTAFGGGDEWIGGGNPAQALLVAAGFLVQPALAVLVTRRRARVTLLIGLVAGLNVLAAHGGARYLLPATLTGLAFAGALLATLADKVRFGTFAALGLLAGVVGIGNLPAYADIQAAVAPDELSRVDETQAAIGALDARGLHLGYADYWTAFPITYLSGERIVVSPALPLAWGRGADRYPPYTRRVASESAASVFLLVDRSCGPDSYLAALDMAGVTYQAEPVSRWLLVWDIQAAPETLAAALASRARC